MSQIKMGARERVLAARALAARRRFTLTLALLLLSMGTWIAVAVTPMSAVVAVLPTLLLGAVLFLGRRAVISAQRADAARAARLRKERAAARSRAGQARAVVVGRAIRGSQASTAMLSSVEVNRLVAARNNARSAQSAGAVSEARERSGTAPTQGAGGEVRSAQVADPDVVGGSGRGDTHDAPRSATTDARPLEAYSVPRPTYAVKDAAPRREPAPLRPEDVTTPATASERAHGGASAHGGGTHSGASANSAHSGLSAASPLTAEELEDLTPSPDGLGVDLNQILARRRAASA